MDLTENEKEIIKFLREANPYEKVEITKDGEGKVKGYIFWRSQKIVLKEKE